MTELSIAFPELARFNNDFSLAADRLLIEIISQFHAEARNEDIRKAEERISQATEGNHNNQAKRQLLQRLKSYIPGSKSCLHAPLGQPPVIQASPKCTSEGSKDKKLPQ